MLRRYGDSVDGNLVPLTTPLEYRPPVHARNVVVKAVCSGCNNGWMSKLEVKARPTLLRFQNDDTVALAPDEAATVVHWAHKTSTMLDRWSTGRQGLPHRGIHGAPREQHALRKLAHPPGSCRRRSRVLLPALSAQVRRSAVRLQRTSRLPRRRPPDDVHWTPASDGALLPRSASTRRPRSTVTSEGWTLRRRFSTAMEPRSPFEPARWPTYDFDVWDNWDLWQPFEGPGVVGLIEGPAGELVVTNLPGSHRTAHSHMPRASVVVGGAEEPPAQDPAR